MKKILIKLLTAFFCILVVFGFVACANNEKDTDKIVEKICIIDASVSMRTSCENTTRFEKALKEVRTLSEEVFKKDGVMTIIIADDEPNLRARRVTAGERILFYDILDRLMEEDTACSYGSANIESAITLANTMIEDDYDAEILFYTDTGTKYTLTTDINVIDVSNDKEWNAAILDAKATLIKNSYMFQVDVVSYNRNVCLYVELEILGTDGIIRNFTLKTDCPDNQITHIIFINSFLYTENEKIFEIFAEDNTVYYLIAPYERIDSYQSIYISLLAANDSLAYDNLYCLYSHMEYVFEVGDTIQLNPKYKTIEISFGGDRMIFDTPTTFIFEKPGTYIVEQTLASGELIKEHIFVKIPVNESSSFEENKS